MIRSLIIFASVGTAVFSYRYETQTEEGDTATQESQQSIALLPPTQSWDGKQNEQINTGGFTNLAHLSAIQVKSALHNLPSGTQNTLHSSTGSATTAQAAVIGKQTVVNNLRHQLQEAQQALQEEITQYYQAQQTAASAQQTAQQAHQQVTHLMISLNVAQETLEQAKQAAHQAANNVVNQASMVQTAKVRLSNIIQRLHIALTDLQETEVLAQKTQTAAQIAQVRANTGATGASQHTDLKYVHPTSGANIVPVQEIVARRYQ